MNPGITLDELSTEIRRQEGAKQDWLVPAGKMALRMGGPGEDDQVTLWGREAFRPNPLFHDQLATEAGIPRRFYRKLGTNHPDLLEATVNRLLGDHPDRVKMVRTLDGNARALLSDRYLRVDHAPVLETAEPELEALDLRVVSSAVTPLRLYVQATSPLMDGELREGEVVSAGLLVSNSEVGHGAVRVEPTLHFQGKGTGLIVGYRVGGYTRHHLGRVLAADEDGLLDTEAGLPAVLEDLRIRLRLVMDEEGFRDYLASLRATQRIALHPALEIESLIERLNKRFPMNDSEQSLVAHRLHAEEPTAFGVVQAVSGAAGALRSYDRGIDFQRFGGALAGLEVHEWVDLTKAPKATRTSSAA